MRLWKAAFAGAVAIAGLTSAAVAQIPSATPLPGLGGSAAGAASAGMSAASGVAGAAGSQKTIWGFFGLSKENCAACKKKFCSSNLGMMVNGMIAPMGAMTGGLLQPCCPTVPSAADVAAAAAGPGGPGGAAAVAAKIKQSEADAKARVAAVEYLGTVDCRRWPDASKALVNALRGDTNECVRYAAARVLNNGCCCTKETIDALKRTVATVPMKIVKDGKEIPDPDPVETSERVRAAAMIALGRCQFLNPESVEPEGESGPRSTPPPPPPGERAASHATSDDSVQLARLLSPDPEVRRSAYLEEIRRKPAAQVLSEARRELEIARRRGPAPIMTTGNRSLLHAVARARVANPREQQQPMPVEQPADVQANAAAPASFPMPTTDRQVLGTSSIVNEGLRGYEAPPAYEAPKPKGGKSLVELFQRSRSRGGSQ